MSSQNGSDIPGSPEEGSRPPAAAQPNLDDLAGQYAARAGVERRDDGQIDVLKSVGGVRGLAEAIVPGLLFTLLYTVGTGLYPSLGAAVASAAVFSVANLAQRRPLVQSLTGLAGVLICAVVAMRSGDGTGYFLPGFFVNGAYILAFLVSVAVKWPVAGLLFGFIRGENLQWRTEPARLKAYTWATWIIISVFALRLAVQLPLALAGNVAALGTTRLAMGVPLYALGLWLAWVVSRPAGSAAVPDSPAGGGPRDS